MLCSKRVRGKKRGWRGSGAPWRHRLVSPRLVETLMAVVVGGWRPRCRCHTHYTIHHTSCLNKKVSRRCAYRFPGPRGGERRGKAPATSVVRLGRIMPDDGHARAVGRIRDVVSQRSEGPNPMGAKCVEDVEWTDGWVTHPFHHKGNRSAHAKTNPASKCASSPNPAHRRFPRRLPIHRYEKASLQELTLWLILRRHQVPMSFRPSKRPDGRVSSR